MLHAHAVYATCGNAVTGSRVRVRCGLRPITLRSHVCTWACMQPHGGQCLCLALNPRCTMTARTVMGQVKQSSSRQLCVCSTVTRAGATRRAVQGPPRSLAVCTFPHQGGWTRQLGRRMAPEGVFSVRARMCRCGHMHVALPRSLAFHRAANGMPSCIWDSAAKQYAPAAATSA